MNIFAGMKYKYTFLNFVKLAGYEHFSVFAYILEIIYFLYINFEIM